MKFTFFHNNINVLDLDKSVEFYKKALGLEVTKEFHAPDGSFKLVYLGDGTTPHSLELTWLRDMDRPYDLGDNESHLAFHVDDMDAALALHKEMDCVCFENPDMGIYFINDAFVVSILIIVSTIIWCFTLNFYRGPKRVFDGDHVNLSVLVDDVQHCS